MERLLADVRDIAAIDARLAEEERKPVALETFLGGMAEGFQRRYRDVRFRLDAPAEGVLVRASPDRLSQVFEQPIGNAAASARGAEVTVSLRRQASQALVEVADQDRGFPQHLARVFDRSLLSPGGGFPAQRPQRSRSRSPPRSWKGTEGASGHAAAGGRGRSSKSGCRPLGFPAIVLLSRRQRPSHCLRVSRGQAARRDMAGRIDRRSRSTPSSSTKPGSTRTRAAAGLRRLCDYGCTVGRGGPSRTELRVSRTPRAMGGFAIAGGPSRARGHAAARRRARRSWRSSTRA